MRKKMPFLLIVVLMVSLCGYLAIDLLSDPTEHPLRETDLYGTWYCEEANACIRVDELETQFCYLLDLFPYEDTEPSIDGSTVTWRDAIGTYSYGQEDETEKLVCVKSDNAKAGMEFIKTEPIAELEELYNAYYSDTYQCIAIGSDKTSLKLHTGSMGPDSYPNTVSRFVVGDELYVAGYCFRIKTEKDYLYLEYSNAFDIVDQHPDLSTESPELYRELVDVFLPWEEIEWYQYKDSDIWGEWRGIETGNKLCIYEDYYTILLSTGKEIRRSNWDIENDAIVIIGSLAFRIQEVDGKLQLVTGELTATSESDTYVRVKPQQDA